TRIVEDGGRWAMIVDYRPTKPSDAAFEAIAHACAELDIVCEGAWGPKNGDAGRAYLAVKHGTSDTAVMNHLRRAELPCTLEQIHPAPPKPKPKATKKKKPAKAKPKPRAKRK